MAQTLKCNEVIRCRTSTTRRISVGFVALLLCGTMACRPEQTDTHEGTGPSPASQTTRAKPFDCTADFKLAETVIRRVTELKSEGTFTLHQCTDLNADGLPETIIRAEGSFFGANHPAFYIYTKSGTTLKRLAESISADMYKILPTRVKGWPGLSFQTQGSGEKPETFIENYVWDGQQYTHAPAAGEPTAAKTSVPSTHASVFYTNVPDVPVLSWPSRAGKILRHVDQNTAFKATGQTQEAASTTWLQVKLPDGQLGWVAKWSLSDKPGQEAFSAVVVSGTGVSFPDGGKILIGQKDSVLSTRFGTQRDESPVYSYKLMGYGEKVAVISADEGQILSLGIRKDYPFLLIKTPEGAKIGDSYDTVKRLYPDLISYDHFIGPLNKNMKKEEALYALYLVIAFGNYLSPSKHVGFNIMPDVAGDGQEKVEGIAAFDANWAQSLQQ